MPDWIMLSSFDFTAAWYSLAALALFGLAGWLVSVAKRDVSIVDSMWSLMFVISLVTYMALSGSTGWRAWLVLGLTSIWALRLSVYITLRNHGEGEDYRYQEIRANNEPHFAFKSLYIVFWLQAVLAWLITFPLMAAASVSTAPGWLDILGVSLWAIGMFFEAVGDAQLSRFKRNPANRGKIMDRGLWRYTRHPNYFGEFLLQWGFFLIAASAGGAWTILAPMLITFLLLRVSGVALLEKYIEERRPGYRQYVRSTNAFFPGRPKSVPTEPALFIVLALALTLPLGSAPLDASTRDRQWNFEVLVNDKPVGQHIFTVSENGDTRYVSTNADFEYKVLFLSLYNYEHENQEIWQGECLDSIRSSTDANGKQYAVRGSREPDGFIVEAKDQLSTLPGCVRTFAYWDPRILESDQLLNAQTGELVDILVTDLDTESIAVRDRTLDARRYRLDAGEVAIDLWYTADGEWVGLETQPREGRIMRYVLQ